MQRINKHWLVAENNCKDLNMDTMWKLFIFHKKKLKIMVALSQLKICVLMGLSSIFMEIDRASLVLSTCNNLRVYESKSPLLALHTSSF